jgi:hypothetical protein
MFEVFALIPIPGLVGGLIAGGAGAYFFGVRDPFLIALAAAVTGLAGLVVVDLGLPWRRRNGARDL